MGRAELKRLTVERFKSYRDPTVLELAPLTVLLGRNNSGKSSLIQALLLLKQTLAYPRSDVSAFRRSSGLRIMRTSGFDFFSAAPVFNM